MKNQLKTGAILNYVSVILNTIITMIFTPIILRYMGQSEYGLYSVVSAVVAYFSVLDCGFGNAMIRFLAKAKAQNRLDEEKNINSLFLFLYIIIGILASIIGIIIYSKFNIIFQNSFSMAEIIKAKKILIVLIINVALTFPLSIFSSYITASEKFVFPRIINIIRIVLYPCIMFPLLLLGYKSLSMVVVIVSLNILSLLMNIYYCFKKIKMKLYFRLKKIDFGILREIFTYSFFVFLNIIVDNVFNSTDQIILGIVSGTVVVSVYSVANQIKNIFVLFSTSISGVFLPKITKIISNTDNKNRTKEVSDIFIKISRLQLYILLLALSCFYIVGKQFINLWVGKEYADAYYITLWLIGFSLVPLTQNIGISILQAMNKHRFRSVMYILIAIINVIISIPLAKEYGGIGAAIGSAIANLIGQIITMNIYYYKVAKIDITKYWKAFMKITIPVAIFSVFIQKVFIRYSCNWITLILVAFTYTIVYLLYIFFIQANTYEKFLVRDLLKKVKLIKGG